MFTLSSTEHVFENRSNASLRWNAFILGLLANKLIGQFLIKISILAKKVKILYNFPGCLLVNRFYCKSSVDDIQKISTENIHNRILTCVAPLHDRGMNPVNLVSLLKSDLLDIPGLNYIFLNVDYYIDNRILKLVSGDGLLNQADKELLQAFTENLETVCNTALQKGKSIILYTISYSCFPALQTLAKDLMQRFNTQRVTVYLLFHLCHVNSPKRVIDFVRNALNQGFTPGIAISKYLTSDYVKKRHAKNDQSESSCHSFNETKQAYHEVTKYLLNNIDYVSAFMVSHNPDNILYLTSLMENYQIGQGTENVIFAQRYGMAKHISFNLANRGYNTALIVPYGTLESALIWMNKLYQYDPSLPIILIEQRFSILRELNRRKLENK